MLRSAALSRPVLHGLVLLLAVPIGLPPMPAGAADWPQIRGPERDGLARGERLARAWGPDGPPLLWRRPLGEGFSGIAAVDGRLYTLAAGTGRDAVSGDEAADGAATEDALCLDADTGAVVWRTALGQRFDNTFGNGPRATPTVDGDTVYAVTSDLQLAALDAADGAVRWRWDLGRGFGTEVPRFGYSASPLVVGDLLVVDAGGWGDGRGVVAFDKRTGEVRWHGLDGAPSHASPLPVTLAGEPQLVFHRRAGTEIVALSTAGEPLWRHPIANDIIAMPLFVPPDRFLVSSATSEGVMLRVTTAEDGGYAVAEAWRNPRFRNHFNTSVLVGGHLYGFDNATLRAVDAATGELGWAKRGFGKGSLAAADGLLVVLGDKGTLALVAADPARYVELGRVQALEGRTWTPPTVAGGRVYVRDHDEMAAYDVSARGAEAGSKLADAGASSTAGDVAAAVDMPDDVAAVLARYAAARGGVEAWRRVRSLEATGTYATFSVVEPFVLKRRRGDAGDLYRIEHHFLGAPITKARDAGGPWWIVEVFEITEPSRVRVPGYAPVLEREARFEPVLLTAAAGGSPSGEEIDVELVGAGEVDGRPTIDLAVTLPDGWQETWHLDPETYLEVAVDATVPDVTQSRGTFARRTFYSDFRDVGGLVLAHRVAHEFGARLEEMVVESVTLDPTLPDDVFRFTGEEPAEEGSE